MPEVFINSDAINNAKINKDIIINKNFFNIEEVDPISWDNIFGLFMNAKAKNAIDFYSFANCSINLEKIDNDEQINSYIKSLSNVYDGNKLASSLSINFIDKNNTISSKKSILNSDDNVFPFKQYFDSSNPYETPTTFPPPEAFIPPKISYPVDMFFIQAQGSSFWQIYGNIAGEEYTLNSENIIFIPKNIIHSTEYLSPGSILSVAFSD